MTCPICKRDYPTLRHAPDDHRRTHYECPRCSDFAIGALYALMIKGDPANHLLSGAIREINERGEEKPILTLEKSGELIAQAPKTVAEQAGWLLHAIFRRSKRLGDLVKLEEDNAPLAYARDLRELTMLAEELARQGLLTNFRASPASVVAALSVRGWNRVEVAPVRVEV